MEKHVCSASQENGNYKTPHSAFCSGCFRLRARWRLQSASSARSSASALMTHISPVHLGNPGSTCACGGWRNLTPPDAPAPDADTQKVLEQRSAAPEIFYWKLLCWAHFIWWTTVHWPQPTWKSKTAELQRQSQQGQRWDAKQEVPWEGRLGVTSSTNVQGHLCEPLRGGHHRTSFQHTPQLRH